MTSQEDDATELQFPKGMETQDVRKVDNDQICSCCSSLLQFPYIHCFCCESVDLCLSCFAKGKEFECHRNDHSYIVKENINIFDGEWKANEELRFLKAVTECGFGNWSDVSKYLNNRSAEDCKIHYFKYFIDNPCSELSVLLQGHPRSSFKANCFHPALGIDDPPRPLPCSGLFREMAGYNAARSEFMIEHLNDAEDIIEDISPTFYEHEDEPFMKNLVLNLIDIYRRQLGERSIRKRVIREHGLINPNRTSVVQNFFKSTLPKYAGLISLFHTLLSHDEITCLIEGLILETELKEHIMELKECRNNGLVRQAQVSIYETLKKRRENLKKRKHKLVLGHELLDMNKLPTSRRTIPPIDITGKSEYETLNPKEIEIASTSRILPVKFNKIKFGMIEECRKLNGLQLCHARSQYKIDVNKIRKIYNYLLSEGLIYQPITNK